MQTVYDHITANNRKTWLLLLLFPTVLSLLTILATVLAFYAMGDLRFAAHFVTPHQEFLLSHNIAITAGNVYWLAGLGSLSRLICPLYLEQPLLGC